MPGTTIATTSPLVDLLFEEGSAGRCLVAPDGSVLRANAAWLRETGLSADDALGADVVALFPETRDLTLALHARARAGHRVEVPRHVQHLGGRETWWEGTIDPVPMEGGTGLLITAREVRRERDEDPGERPAPGAAAEPGDDRAPAVQDRDALRVAQALQDSELRLRRLIEANPIGVVEGDVAGNVVDANEAYLRIVGYTRAELRAGLVRWDAITPAAHLARDAQAIEEVREHGVSAVYEKEYVRRDGTRVPVLVACASYGGAGGLVAFVVDITERKRTEEALRESDRRKGEFLAVLSHELRNPLAPIRNGVSVLERAEPGSRQAARATAVIRRQADHLARLVDDLLDVTRMSSGKFRLQRDRVDLRDVVRRTVDDLRSVFADDGVALRVEHVTPGPAWVDADPARVAQALGNLLQNAAKFTPAGGSVSVTLAHGGGRAELRVRDTGVGMEPGTVERMFEPFAQAEQTLARTTGGLGLGLALVKGIVEMHGGRVAAHSDGLGHGAEFSIELPLVAEDDAAGREDARAASASSRIVLVIEDNLDAGDSLADLLELDGHRVRVARDGRSGIRLARELRPDVVLCDIGLPDLDGYQVARALRGDDAVRSALLVALSGYGQRDDVERAREAGFDVHLVKPPAPEQLQDVLGRRK